MFPLFVDLTGRKCLVIGAGKTAERRCRVLSEYGGKIYVYSKEYSPYFEGLFEQKRAEKLEKLDLDGGWFLAIAATGDRDFNDKIISECEKRNIFVSSVTRGGNFLFPSAVKRGKISIGISAGGSSPSLTKILRQEIEKTLPQNIGEISSFMEKHRETLKALPFEKVYDIYCALKSGEKTGGLYDRDKNRHEEEPSCPDSDRDCGGKDKRAL